VSWKCASASVAGRSHADEGTPCQDAAAVASGPGVVAAAVADGAGSASLSHFGAAAVTRTMAGWLVAESQRLIAGAVAREEIIAPLLAAIDEARQTHSGTVDDYACTLLAVVLAGERGAALHLGDGVIAAVRDGQPRLISGPDNGEFANSTLFVTSGSAARALRITRFSLSDRVSSFVLMTDGAQSSLFDKRTGAVSNAIAQMASWLDEAPENEVSRDLERNVRQYLIPRTTDDCTLLLLRRVSPFVCPACGPAGVRRAKGGRRHFRLVCKTCGRTVLEARSAGRAYPPEVHRWLHYLLSKEGLSLPAAGRRMRVPERTLKRWLELK